MEKSVKGSNETLRRKRDWVWMKRDGALLLEMMIENAVFVGLWSLHFYILVSGKTLAFFASV